MFFFVSTNHNLIGMYYIIVGVAAGVLGMTFSLVIRMECSMSGAGIIVAPLAESFYNLSITLHGLAMIFFFTMPVLFGGLGNIFVPLLCGCSEVCFPRINNVSFALLCITIAVAYISVVCEFGAGCGWTNYAPLASTMSSLASVSQVAIISALIISSVSSTFTALNLFVTTLAMRTHGLVLSVLSVFVHCINVVSFLLLLVGPVLILGLVMLLLDLCYNASFFDAQFGGDVLYYQHLFWFFGHPEVYVLALPAFGWVSRHLSIATLNSLFGNQAMILAVLCIAVLGCIVWAHHMYVTGLEADTVVYFAVLSLCISLPTGTKVFNWLCSNFLISPITVVSVHAFLTMSFVLVFVIGGVTGIILANAVVDVSLHDTYYVVAHFHVVLSMSIITTVMLIVASRPFPSYTSLSHLSPIFLLLCICIIVGSTMAFVPQFFLGLATMPRRMFDFADACNGWHYVSTLGSTTAFVGAALLLALGI